MRTSRRSKRQSSFRNLMCCPYILLFQIFLNALLTLFFKVYLPWILLITLTVYHLLYVAEFSVSSIYPIDVVELEPLQDNEVDNVDETNLLGKFYQISLFSKRIVFVLISKMIPLVVLISTVWISGRDILRSSLGSNCTH